MNQIFFLARIFFLFFPFSLSKSIIFITAPTSEEFFQIFNNLSRNESLEIFFHETCEINISQPIIITSEVNVIIKSTSQNSLIIFEKQGEFKILDNSNFTLIKISIQPGNLIDTIRQLLLYQKTVIFS